MPKPRTASAYAKGGVIWTKGPERAPGKRVWYRRLPGDPNNPADMIRARAAAADYQRAVDAGEVDPWDRKGAPKAPAAETVAEYFGRLCAARAAAGYRTVRDDRYRYAKHVAPLLGAKAVAAVTPDDIEAVRDALDAKIAADQLKPKSAMNVWGLVSVIFDAAAHAKKASGLRVRADDPCRDIKPPEPGDSREGPYLYPSEYLAFAAAESTPVGFARLATVELYQRLRAGEGDALEVGDLDLAHDTLAVDRATDKFTGEVVDPKSRAGRRVVPIEPACRPLLAALVAEARAAGRARLFVGLPDRRDYAALLRAYVKAAGCDRPRLYVDDAAQRPLWWHDLRATGVTWQIQRGDHAVRVQRRAGHTSLDTTQKYIRAVDDLDPARFGAPFPPVPARLLGAPIATPIATAGAGSDAGRSESAVRGTGVEHRRRATGDDTTRLSGDAIDTAVTGATPGDLNATAIATGEGRRYARWARGALAAPAGCAS